ncbi:MAG: metallophosphoesterase [Spirochaetaceae bacterium]
MKGDEFGARNLSALYDRTPVQRLTEKDQYVIFSDLHMGNGKHSDDFAPNSELFLRVLGEYYYPKPYGLILNGDVEELQRFSLDSIMKRWERVYELFSRFEGEGRLDRLFGNHDMALKSIRSPKIAVKEALRFDYRGDEIFLFHGHQTSIRFEVYNDWFGFVLKYFANPLRIKNYEVSHDSEKRFRVEQRVYNFASSAKLLSIIGHTHRPLFESMSKIDSLKFEIERLIRKYPKSAPKKKPDIERRIREYKAELLKAQADRNNEASAASLYRENLVVPCMFNSGCVLGKRGMTALEIDRGQMRLVHWFDRKRSEKYLSYEGFHTEKLPKSDFYRVIIKEESLDYIMSRIRLLA